MSTGLPVIRLLYFTLIIYVSKKVLEWEWWNLTNCGRDQVNSILFSTCFNLPDEHKDLQLDNIWAYLCL